MKTKLIALLIMAAAWLPGVSLAQSNNGADNSSACDQCKITFLVCVTDGNLYGKSPNQIPVAYNSEEVMGLLPPDDVNIIPFSETAVDVAACLGQYLACRKQNRCD